MKPALGIAAALALLNSSATMAQQVPDLDYNPPIADPAYAPSEGPRIGIDEGHHNFHTAEGRYSAFARLLRRDGYVVESHPGKIRTSTLDRIDILVIANPIHGRNDKNWVLPTPSAYTKDEIEAIHAWVDSGGALFLIADHMPFPGGAGKLANAFGIQFSNGFAYPSEKQRGKADRFQLGSGLKRNALTRGRNASEAVSEVATFTGSAFKVPEEAIPILMFGPGSYSLEPEKAWDFKESTKRVSIEGWCQGAYLKVGAGRLVVFGEAAMFTAQRAGAAGRPMGMSRPEAAQNHQLLLNTVHWLSGLIDP